MPLIDTDLVARYYIDEAASGTTPTEVLDGSGVGIDADLTINYDGHLAYVEDSGQRGLVSDSETGDQYARVDAGSTKFDTMMDDTKVATLEVVADLTSGRQQGGRVVAFQESTSNSELGLVIVNTDARIYFQQTLVRSWTVSPGRKVYHIVVDTTQATPNDRVKLYVDGVEDTGIDVDANPNQDDQMTILTGDVFYLFNRGVTSWDRSIIGTIYYVGVYAGAFSDQDASDNYDVLILDDDTPSEDVDNLTADGISTTPVLGTPTIGQAHALAATGITSSPVVDTPTLGQEHALVATGIATGAPVLSNPTLSEVHVLTATGVATTPVLGTPTIGQVHALEATGIASSPVVGTPVITQAHALIASGIATGAPVLGTPTLAEGVDNLTATGIATGAPTLGTPTLAQVHALIASGIATGVPVLSNPTLAVNVDALVAVGISVTPILGTPTLAQIHALIATGITAAPILGTPTLFEGGAVGLATMTFEAKIPSMSIASSQPSMGFTSSQPRIDITEQ